MGWFYDEEGLHDHEGYLLGLVEVRPGSRIFRELNIDDTGEHQLKYVCVGCECGWRSPRLLAPSGTDWIPYIVSLARGRDDSIVEAYEESARKLWCAHIDDVRKNGRPALRVDEDGLRAAWDRAARRRA